MFTPKTFTRFLAACAIALSSSAFSPVVYAAAPVATDNNYTIQTGKILYGNVLTDGTPDSDPDGNSFIIPDLPNFTGQVILPIVGQGSLVISPTGQFAFTPAIGFTGNATFQYSICDNGTPVECSGPSLATVTITVTAIPAGQDNDGDFIADIDDLDDDNDGILDINEYCGPTVGVYGTGNFLLNERFSNISGIVPPFPKAPGTEWATGYGWTSGVPFEGIDVYSADTRVSIQTKDILVNAPGFPANGVIAQKRFPGDAAEGVAASDNYLYSNGNNLGIPYTICEQQITGLRPGIRYSFVCYTSSAINPEATNTGPGGVDPPDDGIMQFFFNGNPTGQPFYVHDDADPRSFYPASDPRSVDNGKDKWVRREVFFTTGPTINPATSYPFSLRDFQLGVNGDDFVLTSIGIREFNTFGCLPSDPSKDDDADNTVNWQDAQWLATVPAGIVIDADGDGIINQFDLDSDGDGCADAKEAGFNFANLLTPKNDPVQGDFFVVKTPYGSNGLADVLEKAAESNLVNYTIAVTGIKENFLSNTVFTACSIIQAANDAANTNQGVAVTIPILNNDAYEGKGSTLPAIAINGAAATFGSPTPVPVANGTIILNADGTVAFTPNPAFAGPTTTFQYTITVVVDGKPFSSTATVTVTINPAALAAVSKTITIAKNSIYNFGQATSGFGGIDDFAKTGGVGALQSVIIGGLTGLPAGSTLTLNGTPVLNGTEVAMADIPNLRFTPAANQVGSPYGTFTYQTKDISGTGTTSGTITINVIEPIAAQPGNVTTSLNTPYVFKTADFPVASGTVASVIVKTLPAKGILRYKGTVLTSLPAGGLVIPVGEISNGDLVFEPANNESGIAYTTFGFALRDGNNIEGPATTMTVNVIRANDDGTAVAPIAVQTAGTTNIDVLANDTKNSGAVTLNPVTAPSSACFTVTIINNGTASAQYQVDASGCPLNNTYTFQYTFTQNGVTSNAATVTFITVSLKPVIIPNAPPVVVTLPEDNKVGGNPAPETFADPSDNFAAQVIASFTVIVPTRIQIASLPPKGRLLFNGTSVTVGQEIAFANLNNLVYEPVFNQNGNNYTQFTVKAAGAVGDFSDGAVTVNINITPVQDPPSAQNDNNITERDKPVVGNALSNDTDPDGDAIAATAVTNAPTAQGGTITLEPDGTYTYTPKLGFTGLDTYLYEVCDNAAPKNCSKATIIIQVNPPAQGGNRPPIAGNDNAVTEQDKPATGNVLINDSDPDGDALTVTAATNAPTAQGGTITISTAGIFTYTPKPGYVGIDSYVYVVCDNKGLCATATLTISVTPLLNGNRPPIAQNDDNRTGLNTQLTVAANAPKNLLANDSDPDGDPIAVTPVTNQPTTQDGRITVNANGSYTYTPRTGFAGKDTYTYEVCDNRDPKGCATATLTITINRPPVVVAKRDTLVNPNRPGAAAASLTTVNLKQKVSGTDTDGTIASYTIATLPTDTITKVVVGKLYYTKNSQKTEVKAGDVLTAAEAATLAYEPPAGYSGATVKFTYSAIDNDGAVSNTANYNLWIINRPVAQDDRAVVIPNSSQVPIRPYRNDADPDVSATLAFSALDSVSVRIPANGNPRNGTATVANGIISYTPNNNFRGTDEIQYIICDLTPASAGGPLCDTAVIRIEVREPFIPEGITPNGDGQHDFFIVENPNNEPVALQIFNRWGNLVFESTDFKQDRLEYDLAGRITNFSTARSEWGGKTNRGLRVGEDLPDGTYFYIVKYKNSGFTKARYMTLIR